MKIWNVKTGSLVRTITVTGTRTYTVRVSGRGRYVVTSSNDGSLMAWSVKTGRQVRLLSKTGWIRDYSFSPDGRRFIAPTPDGITVWNLDTWKVERTLEGHTGSRTVLAVDPFSRYLASSGADGGVKVWELRSGRLIKTFETGIKSLRIAWGNRGREIVAPGADNTIRIYGIK